MNQSMDGPFWRSHLLDRHLPWNAGPIRPSEIGDGLCEAALARENLLEDAEYHKVSPNWFVVEVSQENYQLNYLPIQGQILGQWKDRLLNCLLTVNNRQGRSEFRFAGAVRVEIRPAHGLKPSQARILCSIQAGEIGQSPVSACLQSADGSKAWPLRPGVVTMGRDAACDVYIDSPEVQRKKLVSGRHAYIYCQEDSFRLFDGSPDGRPSKNGTFVNLARVPRSGVALKDGDQILLAVSDPTRPDPQAPGVAVLWLRLECG
jgi:FHA domain